MKHFYALMGIMLHENCYEVFGNGNYIGTLGMFAWRYIPPSKTNCWLVRTFTSHRFHVGNTLRYGNE